MNNFKLVSIVALGDNVDEYTYNLRTSNCIVKLVAVVDSKCGGVQINIIQTLGFVKEEEKIGVLRAILDALEQFEEFAGKDYNLFLDPEGDSNLFVQELYKLGLFTYFNKDRQNFMEGLHYMLKEMVDFDAILDSVSEPYDSDEIENFNDFEDDDFDLDFDFSSIKDIDDDELPF